MKKLMVGAIVLLFLVSFVSALECSQTDLNGNGASNSQDLLWFNANVIAKYDFNNDNLLDSSDMLVIRENIQNNTGNLKYDINGNGAINSQDMLRYQSLAIADNDYNNDSKVDSSDLQILSDKIRECNLATNISGSDSDSGLNYNLRGTCVDNDENAQDFCVSEGGHLGWLREYTFDSRYGCGTSDYNCPNGCSNGACIQGNLTEKDIYQTISSDGTYTVKQGDFIEVNKINARIREISWALSGDTEPKVEINGDNARTCSLHEGESCEFYYGPVSNPISKNLRISVNSIETDEENPIESTASITITSIYENNKSTSEECTPEWICTEWDEKCQDGLYQYRTCLDKNKCGILENKPFLWKYCWTLEECETIGLRQEGMYCSSNNGWVEQKKEGTTCENNFECDTNVCVDGECISSSFIQKILNWLRNFFGRD